MDIFACSSTEKKIEKLVSASEGLGTLIFLKPGIAATKKELEFAFYLAEQAFEDSANISKKMANEVLLFLANETNFSSALKKVGAENSGNFWLAAKEKIPLAKMKKALNLTKAKKLKMPEWGKKIGHYFEGELAIERMALERIRN